MVRLSPDTTTIVRRMFAPEQQAQAQQLLEEACGNNLPFMDEADEYGLERIRYAVLKLSEGNPDSLQGAIRLAQQDWRDALVSAGFANDTRGAQDLGTRAIKSSVVARGDARSAHTGEYV